MTLRSTYGAVDLTADMKNGGNKKKAAYSANIKTNELNVGALTKQPQNVGMVSFLQI